MGGGCFGVVLFGWGVVEILLFCWGFSVFFCSSVMLFLLVGIGLVLQLKVSVMSSSKIFWYFIRCARVLG